MINTKQLRKRCGQKIEEFRKLGEYTDCGDNSGYTFIDNGANILAVAHLDVVQRVWKENFFTSWKGMAMSPALDDRLGVHIILDVLPKMGIVVDVLLTENEEIGLSTAMFFNTSKKYKWIFQFDRRGTDVVMYNYHTKEMSSTLYHMGFDVGYGTFSDICYLEHLGVHGFNFGCGYYNEHTLGCYAKLDETELMLVLFKNFHKKFKNKRLQWSQPQPKVRKKKGKGGTYTSHYDYGYMWRDQHFDMITPYEEDEMFKCQFCSVTFPYPDESPMGSVCCDCYYGYGEDVIEDWF